MDKLEIATDKFGNQVVVIPKIIFKNKQNIDWNSVEKYLQEFIGKSATITETKGTIFIGTDFPDEYKGSEYSKHLKGAKAKAKANAAQAIFEMVAIATEKRFSQNHKVKHNSNAGMGWNYYTTRFAIPIYENDAFTGTYNIYSACLVINCTKFGKMYLYDLVDIKKEASTPLKTIK